MANLFVRFLFAFLLATPGLLSAQAQFSLPRVAELEQKFADQPNVTNADALSNAYIELAWRTILRERLDSMRLFLDKSQQTWLRVKPQNEFTKAKSLLDPGRFYYRFKREYVVADSFYQLANPWIFKTDSIELVVISQIELANIYLLRGFKQKGADLAQQWVDKVENIADKKTRSRCFDELRRFYQTIGRPDALERAMYYAKRDFALTQEIYKPNDPRLMIHYCQMETIYYLMGKTDSAIIMLKHLEARLSEADIFRQVWILMVGANNYLEVNDVQTAKSYLNRVWPLVQANHLEETDDGQHVIFLLGRVAHLEGRLGEAEAYFKRALATCQKLDYKPGSIDVLKELVEVVGKQNKYREQARYQKELSETEVLLAKETYSKSIAEMETQFKVLEKDSQIKEEHATQRLLWLGLALAAVLMALSAWFYLRLNKQRRALAQQNAVIDRQNKELTKLNEVKSRFFTNISHEFRTPLTVILGVAEQLKGGQNSIGVPRSHTDTATSLDLIQRNGQNLLRLINQILDLSKMDSGLLKVEWQRGDIVAYLQYLSESLHSLAQEREIRLVFYPETPELEMDYDAEKMQAIVTNLLSNALKFTPRGGKVVLHAKTISHATAGAEKSECLQLIMQDTGKGIPKAELPHIFDRFYQVDGSSTRRGEGTGIGLTLVKELTELLGGSIAVESTEGKGTTFTVLLPVHRQAEILEASPLPAEGTMVGLTFTQPLPPNLQPSTQPSTLPLLLIIEDNADVATYLSSLLQTDYQIEWAPDGQAGIERALEMVPDIIISDVMMPEKDGYEVCHALKNDERTSHVPIILLTAKATQADKLAGLRTGADVYLEKPFQKEELMVRLEKLLELRATLQARYTALAPAASVAANGKPMPTLDDIFLQKLHDAVLEKLDDPELDMAHLCHAARLSRTQVFRKLKALTGENPTQYISRLRLKRALELLQTTHLNVSEVAYKVGFNDPNYFSRVFQKEYGKVPSEVRN